MWPDLHQELKITEPEIEMLDETFKPVFGSKSSSEVAKLTMDIKSKRSRSSPSLSLLFQEQYTSPYYQVPSSGTDSAKKQHSESDILVCLPKNTSGSEKEKEKKLHQKVRPSSNKEDLTSHSKCQLPSKENCADKVMNSLVTEEAPLVEDSSIANDANKSTEKQIPQIDISLCCDRTKKGVTQELDAIQRLSVCLEERQNATELQHLDNDDGSGANSEELDLVEPWEDIISTKQWVTSPLHSPDIEELFNQLSPFGSNGETLSSGEGKTSPPSVDEQSAIRSGEHLSGNTLQTTSSKPKTNWTYLPPPTSRVSTNGGNTAQPYTGKNSTVKQKNTASSQRFYRQMSYEAAAPEKREENYFSKHRPYSLNLDTGHRYIRDISNQQNRDSSEFSSCQRGFLNPSGTANNGLPSELELFLSDRQAPLRRNSAPVSVSSVRTAFMIKTCQAKAVPVIPPRVQYSQIPHSRHEDDTEAVRQQEKEKERPKMSVEKSNTSPPPVMSDLKEELENKEPSPKHQKHHSDEKYAEPARTAATPEVPVITRRQAPSLEVFVDCPRPNRGNILQRPSFRNRQRPQSLILLSPPFPIMDYQPSGDESKLLSSIKTLNDVSAGNVLSKEVAEGIALQNKMTIPKSGQRLETSTSCFYQPQRRSMIFESRSHRQIE